MKKLFNNKGVTLVEVVIALALIVILASMFAGIMTVSYRSNLRLSQVKKTREDRTASMEYNPDTGTLEGEGKIVLDTDVADILYTADDTTNSGIPIMVYKSAAYGAKANNDDNLVNTGYVYNYTKKN